MSDLAARVVAAFAPAADPAAAAPMAKYMRDQFPFLGINSPARRAATRVALSGVTRPAQADLDARESGQTGDAAAIRPEIAPYPAVNWFHDW